MNDLKTNLVFKTVDLVKLSEYLCDAKSINKLIQIINGNYNVLYYGIRDQKNIPFNCSELAIIKIENISDVVDCVTVEYDFE